MKGGIREVKSLNKIRTQIEVRYQETDQMGVVYHANYLVWFEIGRTKFIEQLGFKYAQLEEQNIVSPVVDLQISYKKPARYGESVIIETSLHHYDGIRTIYAYRVINEQNELLVEGNSTHVIVKKDKFRPVPLRKVNTEWDLAYQNVLNGDKL